MVLNPRHHRNAGRRVSCIGHRRLTSVLAFGRVGGNAVSRDFLSGPTHTLPTCLQGGAAHAVRTQPFRVRFFDPILFCIGLNEARPVEVHYSMLLGHRPLEWICLPGRRTRFECPVTWWWCLQKPTAVPGGAICLHLSRRGARGGEGTGSRRGRGGLHGGEGLCRDGRQRDRLAQGHGSEDDAANDPSGPSSAVLATGPSRYGSVPGWRWAPGVAPTRCCDDRPRRRSVGPHPPTRQRRFAPFIQRPRAIPRRSASSTIRL